MGTFWGYVADTGKYIADTGKRNLPPKHVAPCCIIDHVRPGVGTPAKAEAARMHTSRAQVIPGKERVYISILHLKLPE
jgi:hypothetical protein